MQLKDVLKDHFSLAELKELAYELKIDYEDFPSTKKDFVLEFIKFCQRHDRYETLVEKIRENRSDIIIEEDLPSINPGMAKKPQTFSQILIEKRELIAVTIVILGTIYYSCSSINS